MNAQAAAHVQQVVEGDRGSGVVAALPARDRCGRGNVEQAVAHEETHQRVGDALRHRPRDEGRVGAGAGTVLLGHDLPALHDDDRVRLTEFGWLGEGAGEHLVGDGGGHGVESASAFSRMMSRMSSAENPSRSFTKLVGSARPSAWG